MLQHPTGSGTKQNPGKEQNNSIYYLSCCTSPFCASPQVDKAQENPKKHPTASQHRNKLMSITLTSWQYLLKQTYVSQSDIPGNSSLFPQTCCEPT